MKKLTLVIGLFFAFTLFTNGQNVSKRLSNLTPAVMQSLALKKNNISTNTTIHRDCGTMHHLQWMLHKDPTLKQRMDMEEKKIDDYIITHKQELENNKTVYVLPVVVHVVYNGAVGYIAPSRATEQLNQTNSDWAGTNGRPMGVFNASLRSNSNITLCLANKDPNGNATSGIDYVPTTHSTFVDDDQVKSSSTGGANAWDPTKYFNIWVCDLGGGLCGYSQFPTDGINSTYGSVIHYQYFGLTGAVPPYNLGGTFSHEGGHCLNLYHIWGDDAPGSCTGTDYCADTPNQADATYGHHTGLLTDNCSPTTPGIMYMDFMDYSDDQDYANYTQDQDLRMQAAVSTYLSSVANSANSECSSTGVAPVAAFTASATTVAPGTTVNFTDLSTNGPTGFAWVLTPSTGWAYAGGTNSGTENLKITFNTLGSYTVKLTASNSYGSNSATKNNYITVTNSPPPAACDTTYPASFTSGTCNLALYVVDAVQPYDSGFICGQNAYLDKEKAMLYTGVANSTVSDVFVMYGYRRGTSGNTSVKIYSSNGGAPGTLLGTSATITKGSIDTTNHGLNYTNKYHFASAVNVANDFFVSMVLPIGFTSGSNELAILSTQYTCSSTSPLAYEMWSDGSWNSFATAYGANIDMAIFPKICTTVGVLEENELAKNIIIYPNPANDVLNIGVTAYEGKGITVKIYSAIGQLIKSVENKSASSIMKFDLSGYKSGIYYVSIITDTGTLTKKISIIK